MRYVSGFMAYLVIRNVFRHHHQYVQRRQLRRRIWRNRLVMVLLWVLTVLWGCVKLTVFVMRVLLRLAYRLVLWLWRRYRHQTTPPALPLRNGSHIAFTPTQPGEAWYSAAPHSNAQRSASADSAKCDRCGWWSRDVAYDPAHDIWLCNACRQPDQHAYLMQDSVLAG